MEGVRPDTFVSHWWGEDFGLPANFAIFAVLCSGCRIVAIDAVCSTVQSRPGADKAGVPRSSCVHSHAFAVARLELDICRHVGGYCEAEAMTRLVHI